MRRAHDEGALDRAHGRRRSFQQNEPMRTTSLILAGVLLAAFSAQASEIATGRRIAERCKACHAIGLRDASPDRKALPFRTLARHYPLEYLQEGFAEGVVVGHDGIMPNFRLSPRQLDAFLAYLRSIQR
jgi:mono/diheme cytochrome c family protein